jgi:hypothetical protein
MMLSSVEDLRASLGYDAAPDILEAFRAALNAAASLLAGRLRTTFDQAAYIDTFYVGTPLQFGTHDRVDLLLSQGFLLVPPAVTVRSAGTVGDFGTTSEVDMSTYASVSNEVGTVSMLDSGISDRYVRVSYTAGFLKDASTPQQYRATDVPDWLKTASRLQAILHMYDNPVTKVKELPIGDQTMLDTQLIAVIDQHIRYRPLALSPVLSS